MHMGLGMGLELGVVSICTQNRLLIPTGDWYAPAQDRLYTRNTTRFTESSGVQQVAGTVEGLGQGSVVHLCIGKRIGGGYR